MPRAFPISLRFASLARARLELTFRMTGGEVPQLMSRKLITYTLPLLSYLFFSPELLAQQSSPTSAAAGTPMVRLSAQDNGSDILTPLTREVVAPSRGPAPLPKPFYEGNDPTRTLPRIGFRYEYARLETNNDANVFTFRADEVVNFSPAWRISGRVELPLIYSDLPSKTGSDAPSSGPYRFGIGNLLTQALLIHDIDDRTAVALGSALIFPTTNQALFGSRNYTMLPTAVARWMLPEISEGSYFAPVVRYGVYVAGPASPTNPYISELQFSPMINIALPNFWFITFFPNTSGSDIRYNLGSPHRGDKGRLFLPADVMLGKALNLSRGRGGVASLEIGVPIVNDYRTSSSLTGTYKFKLEARIELFW